MQLAAWLTRCECELPPGGYCSDPGWIIAFWTLQKDKSCCGSICPSLVLPAEESHRLAQQLAARCNYRSREVWRRIVAQRGFWLTQPAVPAATVPGNLRQETHLLLATWVQTEGLRSHASVQSGIASLDDCFVSTATRRIVFSRRS